MMIFIVDEEDVTGKAEERESQVGPILPDAAEELAQRLKGALPHHRDGKHQDEGEQPNAAQKLCQQRVVAEAEHGPQQRKGRGPAEEAVGPAWKTTHGSVVQTRQGEDQG